MPKWICSSCGADGIVTVSQAKPSLDDRYAVGYCGNCAPVPPPVDPTLARPRRPSPPRTVTLVRSDKWDPETLRRRRDAVADERLLKRYLVGKVDSDSERKRAHELLVRYDAEAAARRAP